MFSSSLGQAIAGVLCWVLLSPGVATAQEPAQAAGAGQKYKLTILAGASTMERHKKGRSSSQAVVMITDSNNVPVPGITVTFLLPQAGTSGATFTTGGFTSVVTSNSAGIATSGSISSTAGSSLSVGVSAATPGGVLTGTASITTAAAATAAVSTATLVLVAIGAVAVGAAIVVTTNLTRSNAPTTPTGSIGAAGAVSFGHP